MVLAPPGFIGIVHLDRAKILDAFCQALTFEEMPGRTRFEKGRPIRSWQPKRDGERNEALDTFVYASAAAGLIRICRMRLPFRQIPHRRSFGQRG
jgi:phage terminase large subunit GpA-like protein